ncbi:MAG: beta-N-acetylhexosaminidase [Oceanospirillaceae bacterium]
MPYGRLMLDVAGLTLTANEREVIQQSHVGGLILFSRNYSSRIQLADLIYDIRQQNSKIVIAVDQEGGRVQRFRDDFVTLPAMFSLHLSYRKSPELALQQATEMGWLMASEITAMDIDISFAPVLDLHWAHSQVIGNRSFGASHLQVSALTTSFIQGMHQAGMRSTGKHFPGHGWATADSHLQAAVDERSLEAIRQDDLQPFTALIKAGLDALMPAHVIYSQVDPNPAGFSAFWLQNVLRNELQFEGVIFSDDLSMEAASFAQDSATQFSDRAKAALEAGCDTALVCNNPKGAIEVLDYLNKQRVVKSERLGRMRRSAVAKDAQRFEKAVHIASDLQLLCQ